MTVAVPTQRRFGEQRPSVEERADIGRAARAGASRSSHREWTPAPNRPDPVQLLEEQNKGRVDWLVPLRHSRMSVSPLTFYRGTGGIMAADLAVTPASGLTVQLDGDAHLSNFGAYASPARELVFDANDFDETLPGPWEWDLKRLAASFTVAAEHVGFNRSLRRKITSRVVEAYRHTMIRLASVSFLDLWYEHLTIDDMRETAGTDAAEVHKRLDRFSRKARSHTSMQALATIAEDVDGRYRIRSDPPVLFPLRELPSEYDPAVLELAAFESLERYKTTLPDHHRSFVDRYSPIDVGVKVVGVGSVGTRCFIVLLEGRDREDPLFLQLKEAGASVLEKYLGASEYDKHGRRVVEGQRLVQAESDIFLGWTEGGPEHHHYYGRQLRDWKGSVDIDAGGTPQQAAFYAQLCGTTLARGHARSGDPVAIAKYVGKSDTLDRAVTDFSEAYAEQNQCDYEAFLAAISNGRLDATPPEIAS
jgi:uncharacterized protein (DUF2252 family)